jgi:hypothetical protein
MAILSCSVAPDMVLYNRTGSDITIYLKDRTTVVQNESSVIVTYPVTYPAFTIFNIGAGNKKWQHTVVYPPSDYGKRRSFYGTEFQCQIEADGSIYVLMPDSEFPTQKLPPQPPGFPLVPHTT